ncbi:MAG TPA: signal peptidase I [Gaiellaceae bacterium]|nr:signal peptidase I [Gaiellaceae bacterium]
MTRSRKTGSTIILATLVGMLAAVWLFFAPPQLLGSTTYTATDGNSMEPMFHKGDLAMTRPASSYHVGEVVLYISPTLHRPVLHRIIAIQNGHYFFKGDNNSFVDPGYATRSELSGRLWLHLGGGGKVLSWMGKPSHAAVIAALATMLLALTGAGTARRRRRRGRRGNSALVTPAPAQSSNGLPRWLHKPRKTTDNIIAGGALALGLVLLAIGFGSPLRSTAPVNAYSQNGSFSYSAKVLHSDPAYPTGNVSTGQPLFLNDFKDATLSFAYQFQSHLKHSVKGTIAMSALLTSDSTWHRTVTIAPARHFTGDLAVTSGVVDLNELRSLLTKLGQDSGDVAASYSVTLQPVVTVAGIVNGKHVSDTFSPTLPFSVTNSIAKLNVAGPATLPGASYQTESPASAQASALDPTKQGTIPGSAPHFLTVARYSLPVSDVRGLGLGLLGLVCLILLLKPLKPKREVWSAERRVAFRYGSVVVDVVSLAATGQETAVQDFENLALMARYLERPIYKAVGDGIETYAVEDGGRLYVFRRPESNEPEHVEPAATLPPEPQAQRPRRHLRIAGAAITLVALITVGTAFTAATVVPSSNVGASTHASSASQLAPSGCTGQIDHVIVLPSGGQSQTISTSNNLIVGSSGDDSVVAENGYNCFIGGGPKSGNSDRFTGGYGNGSQCIVAASTKSSHIKNCSIVSRTP